MERLSTMGQRKRRTGIGIRGLTAILTLIVGIVLAAASARAQDETRVRAGLEIWKSSGCPDCHGAFADGEKQRDEAPTGANLRTAKLDTAALKLTISCGRPGGAGMPAFDEGAYRTRPCYDRPLGPPPDDLYPTPRALM